MFCINRQCIYNCRSKKTSYRLKKMGLAFRWKGLVLAVIVAVAATETVKRGKAQLVENFYGSKCPNLEQIVTQSVQTKIAQTFVTIPATLRLFFHDCFVEVLLLLLSSFFLSFFSLNKLYPNVKIMIFFKENIYISTSNESFF